MRRSHRFLEAAGVPRRRAFTIIELLVAVGIISLLVALSLPALGRARQTAKRTECMNNVRNLNLAMLSVAERQRRFPACGKFGKGGMHHSFVLDLLPDLDQMNLYNKWNQDAGLSYPANQLLAQTHLPILACPVDISVEGFGDLSYVVNGGVGFTVEYGGIHDCPVAPFGNKLDLNGNGQTCVSSTMPDGLPSDRELFFRMGLFFNETWKWDVTVRHHKLDTVTDGLSQTLTMSENMRVGYDPSDPNIHNWASSNPYRTSFYIGNPCPPEGCTPGSVDYARSNAGSAMINSGVLSPEGYSTAPNSFHDGGVNMAFGDGRVQFVSQDLDGRTYAALASPQGRLLEGTPLLQALTTGIGE